MNSYVEVYKRYTIFTHRHIKCEVANYDEHVAWGSLDDWWHQQITKACHQRGATQLIMCLHNVCWTVWRQNIICPLQKFPITFAITGQWPGPFPRYMVSAAIFALQRWNSTQHEQIKGLFLVSILYIYMYRYMLVAQTHLVTYLLLP